MYECPGKLGYVVVFGFDTCIRQTNVGPSTHASDCLNRTRGWSERRHSSAHQVALQLLEVDLDVHSYPTVIGEYVVYVERVEMKSLAYTE